MTPRRIQLSRQRGWRKPDGAIVVARPRRWGNQFVVGQPYRFRDEHGTVKDRAHAVELFQRWMEAAPLWAVAARRELVGRDLACWCPLTEPCHADVLLRIANGGQP